MLRVENLQAAYGHSQVLFDINLSVGAGELVTLLGRNGMGKTTTIRAIMGLLPSRSGAIRFGDNSIIGRTPDRIARSGIGLVPEGRQVFPTLTVRENMLATEANRLGRAPAWTLSRVFAMFPRLAERAGQKAGSLSGGEQQMLAIGRALLTNPKLLILDEATEGLAPLIREDIWRCVRSLKQEGLGILVVDKNFAALSAICDRHFIIEKGVTVWSGGSDRLGQEIIMRYLGI
jgi:branched-chain amino acid transport system ATP-binding protein